MTCFKFVFWGLGEKTGKTSRDTGKVGNFLRGKKWKPCEENIASRAVTNVNIVVKHLNFFDLDNIEMDED